MKPDNSKLFGHISELLSIPLARKYIEDAGGYIISTGVIWPVDTIDRERVFYYLNVIDREIRFLPIVSADLKTAEAVTSQDEILFVIGHLINYIQEVNRQAKIDLDFSRLLEVRFKEGQTPKINIKPQRVLYFGNFSLS